MTTTKSYSGEIRFGATTPSFDLETPIDNTYSIPTFNDDVLHRLTHNFTGELMQRPPRHSAIQIQGQRAYKQARKGTEFEIEPRPITITDLVLHQKAADCLSFELTCSKGTYIRSLANDIGKYLNCGAYLFDLKRTAIGKYNLDAAHQMNFFEAMLYKK